MSIPRSLLASDLDGTLIPLERDPQRLREVEDFANAALSADRLGLAYVTGRHRSLAEAGIHEFGLPQPDLLVCDVGTTLYHRTLAGFVADADYAAQMKRAFGGLVGDDVRTAIGSIDGVSLQEPEKQGTFKISYYTEGRPEKVVEAIRERLAGVGADANLVTSLDAVNGRGLVDVLPPGVAKDTALRFIHEHTGVDEDRLVYAGDSGNDLAAMLCGYRAVVVSNADPTLKRALVASLDAEALSSRVYFAQHPYARGVLDGCRHFGLLE